MSWRTGGRAPGAGFALVIAWFPVVVRFLAVVWFPVDAWFPGDASFLGIAWFLGSAWFLVITLCMAEIPVSRGR